jgi:hypothetical protein
MNRGSIVHYNATMRNRRMILGQRAVLIVALGAVVLVCGSWSTSGGSWSSSNLISPFYTPMSGSVAFSGFYPNARAQIMLWLILITIWTAFSMFLLRGKPGKSLIRPEEGGKSSGAE